MKYILAIDQGTTSSRTFIYNEKLELVAKGQKEFSQHFPENSWVEHDLNEIWSSVCSSMQEALSTLGHREQVLKNIAAIGITNQRETVGAWSRSTSKPLHNAIVWQCRRTAALCEKLKKTAAGKKIEKTSGLVLDPYFSGTKIQWLLKNVSSVKEASDKGDLAFGTIDTFLIWKLSGGVTHKTDVTNASRTLLMNLQNRKWDHAALKTLGVSESTLPEICDSNAVFGKTKGLDMLPDGIPICGVLGDQQAALFGQGCWREGEAKVTYGTGAFLLANVGTKIKKSRGTLSTAAWQINGNCIYALEGAVFIAGAAVQWLRDGLGILKESQEVESLANEAATSDGVFFIPALSGLGSPYWCPSAKGLIGGLTRRSSKGHLAYATLEGIAHSVADQFEVMMKGASFKLKELRADGGAARNLLLLQLQADYLRTIVRSPSDLETSIRGAAMMATLGAGLFKDPKELASLLPELRAEKKPTMQQSAAKKSRDLWKKRTEILIKLSKL